jgi:serine/threonine protein kinase
MLCKEALLWKPLDHPHVLPFLGLDTAAFFDCMCMVSPWMQHGTIIAHLESTNPTANHTLRLVSVGWASMTKLMAEDCQKLCQVSEGLEYLHSKKIIHGDLRGVSNSFFLCWMADIS